MLITKEYLHEHPNEIFVFGDNLERKGKNGAAILRDEPNTYGFITKKYPSSRDSSFYKPEQYRTMFIAELADLEAVIMSNYDKTFLITKLGSGLANKYQIWEEVIKDGIRTLEIHPNVKFLF